MFHSAFSGYVLPVVVVFVISFLISFIFTPFIRRLSLKYGFYAVPNHRSSHFKKVPNTGGILLFLSILIPIYFFLDVEASPIVILLSISFFVLFIIGVLDDLFNVSVKLKFLGQLLPAALIIISLKTQSLVMPFVPASVDFSFALKFVFWMIAVVGIMNAYNFIDGIDGLAIGLGVISGFFFGVYFLVHTYYNLSFLGFSLSGGLLGLLRYNLSREKKIFIGDTGSLIIGGVVSLFILRQLEISIEDNLNFSSSMIFGLLFIPVSDLCRVVFMRLLNRQSPFHADRTHLHHVIIDRFGISHRRTSALIVFLQLVILFIFLGYNELFSRGQIIFSIGMFLAYLLVIEILKRQIKR